jgi:hypothetical protein
VKSHTPGPWKQHVDGEKTYASVRSPVGQIVADCGSRSDLIAQANAKLIAAAPDLLEALQLMTESFVSHFPNGIEVEKARAAIARATT